jgi:hypothetical protein
MVAHEVSLQGAGGAAAGPVILERTEQDFLPALLDRLSREQGLPDVLKSAARTRENYFNRFTARFTWLCWMSPV